MNNRIAALIFTLITVSCFCAQAQIDKYGFAFDRPEEPIYYYPVTVYNYKEQAWEESSEQEVLSCIYEYAMGCEFISIAQSISIRLNPDGDIFTLPNIFNEFYLLQPDYDYDRLRTPDLAITFKSKSLPEYN